jgi:hypothetical protein
VLKRACFNSSVRSLIYLCHKFEKLAWNAVRANNEWAYLLSSSIVIIVPATEASGGSSGI